MKSRLTLVMPGVYIIFIGTMGFAATQLIVSILGIVLLFRGNVNNGKGGKRPYLFGVSTGSTWAWCARAVVGHSLGTWPPSFCP